ncbi:MAG: hypothetical protein OEW52_00165 [Thermoleophilia bacterium]|nr:hypothetical protein [Thermoleophilia bacterium]
MAGRVRTLEWDKQGDLDAHVRFHEELPPGVTLSAPSVELHQRIATEPETWVSRSSEVTLAASVVAALTDKWVAISGGTSRAVRVVVTKDPDAQPDVTDEPKPGDNYRLKIIATRSDSGRPIAREVALRILP